MFKRIILLGILIVPFALLAEEAAKEGVKETEKSSVPALTEPSDKTAKVVETPTVVTPVAVAPEETSKDDNNPAKKSVMNMLDGFRKMAENRQRYLDGKQSYEQYMQKDRKVSEEISEHIDFWDVCEKSLKYDYDPKHKKFRKDHWIGKSQIEKQHFTSLFTNLIEEIVYPIANEYFGDLKMTHKVMEVKKDMVYIKTVVLNTKKRKDREFIMEWFLHPSPNGKWVVYDVGVEGERWVEGFRSQFNDVITKKSYKELLKMMNKKLVEVKEDRGTQDRKDLAAAKAKAKAAAEAEKEVKK